MSVRDSLTAVFWFESRSPLQFFDAVYPMSILPQHAVGAVRGPALRTVAVARAPVGSGRFRFVRWRAGSAVELVADTGNYRGRPHLDRVLMTIAPDFNTALTRVLGGEADMLEQVPMVNVAQLAANPQLRAIASPGLDYNFIQFNLRDPKNRSRAHPVFGDRAMRRALTLAVNRGPTVRNVYDTLASLAVGPTVSLPHYRYCSSSDSTCTRRGPQDSRLARLEECKGWGRSRTQRPPAPVHPLRSELEQGQNEHGGSRPGSAEASRRKARH